MAWLDFEQAEQVRQLAQGLEVIQALPKWGSTDRQSWLMRNKCR